MAGSGVPATVSASGQSAHNTGSALTSLPVLPGAPLPHLVFASIMLGGFHRMPFAHEARALAALVASPRLRVSCRKQVSA